MKIAEVLGNLPFGWTVPDNPVVRSWRAWAEEAGEDIDLALDTCPHPGALLCLVASIAVRSGDPELLRWHAENIRSFVSRPDKEDATEILPDVPRDLLKRAFRSIAQHGLREPAPLEPGNPIDAVMRGVVPVAEAAARFAGATKKAHGSN
jgi:hypothetical protein